MEIKFKPIGWIRTPYTEKPPFQPEPEAEGEFYIDLDPALEDGLFELDSCRYIHVLFYPDRLQRNASLRVHPPLGKGIEVGLFASRSPARPNPVGLSVVRLKSIQGTRLRISGIDCLDNTPLLDIKPYMKRLDIKADANNGWLDRVEGGG